VSEPEKNPRVAYVGTWRYRNVLLQVAVIMPVLAIAVAVSAAVSGRWPGWPAAVCWLLLGFLAFRRWRATGGGEVHAVSRARTLLHGLGLFLLGVVFLVVGAALG
jgi:hypothetical protein